MLFPQKLITIFHLSRTEKLLFLEAILFLALARFLKVIPFKRLTRTLGNHMCESSFQEDPSLYGTIKSISCAIHIMSRYTFWESKCLVKAIAGMKMLQRRGIESTLYLGTAKDEDGKMIAHAWLRSGSYYVCGAEEMKRFTVISKFANK
ncbi:lasso peptide biosynthesis B2 protein [Mesobacillus sp. AQ2]|uniref:lasso peptide biosynthesis B2 protein n=1 Tax=Mesobacillus sp. AQ2 TaxID=3043332 RepID=UPI0024C198DB|nr:lasso peptide biosynthesis B2 protein [Mesobacillus sp. AQ2]WHX41407.1 lasso peptide biosynthesis B2 protein [Mesobacillus sp. AQ2]